MTKFKLLFYHWNSFCGWTSCSLKLLFKTSALQGGAMPHGALVTDPTRIGTLLEGTNALWMFCPLTFLCWQVCWSVPLTSVSATTSLILTSSICQSPFLMVHLVNSLLYSHCVVLLVCPGLFPANIVIVAADWTLELTIFVFEWQICIVYQRQVLRLLVSLRRVQSLQEQWTGWRMQLLKCSFCLWIDVEKISFQF